MKINTMRSAFIERFGEERGTFIYRCVTNHRTAADPDPETYRKYWEDAGTVERFFQLVEDDSTLRYDSQAYGLMCKELRWPTPVNPKRIVKEIITDADAGSVMIGDLAGTSATLFSNGRGDGGTQVVVVEHLDGFNSNAFDLIGVIKGRFQIYDYDCADLKPAAEADLDGRYGVYAWDGVVVFGLWDR